MKNNKPRIVYHVSPEHTEGDPPKLIGWKSTVEGSLRIERYATKALAVMAVCQIARLLWRDQQIPAQVKVHDRHGKFEYERTYGRDPKEHKG